MLIEIYNSMYDIEGFRHFLTKDNLNMLIYHAFILRFSW